MKKIVWLGLLTACGAAAHAQEFHLPFNGRWFVGQAGDTPNVNQHMSVQAQWYGIDFIKTGGPGERSPARPSANASITDFYSWGEPVLAPVSGEVITVIDGFPDNPLGIKDPENPAGNYIVIAAPQGSYVFLAHFQKGSLRVTPGQRVAVGQELGKCGNSGNSDVPHIHMHVQDTPTLNQGQGQNMIFKGINVEMTGKIFNSVDWPLIRGLFVWK